jgi:spore coat-associated protein N
MQRAAVLWRASPARLVAALFALMLAAAMAVGTGANFNATSANVGNVVTAGIVAHTNSGGVILNVSKIKPGDTKTGTVTLKNTGDIDGKFTVASSNVADTPGPNGGNLSTPLVLAIDDMGPAGAGPAVNKYSGALSGATANLGTWTPNEQHVYRFSVTFPNGGAGGADNAYMGSSVTADFNWESTS